MAIYIDGNTYHPSKNDRIITLTLERQGWKVMRILNSDIEDKEMLELHINAIEEALSTGR